MRVETARCSLARNETSLPKPSLVANGLVSKNAAGGSRGSEAALGAASRRGLVNTVRLRGIALKHSRLLPLFI